MNKSKLYDQDPQDPQNSTDQSYIGAVQLKFGRDALNGSPASLEKTKATGRKRLAHIALVSVLGFSGGLVATGKAMDILTHSPNQPQEIKDNVEFQQDQAELREGFENYEYEIPQGDLPQNEVPLEELPPLPEPVAPPLPGHEPRHN